MVKWIVHNSDNSTIDINLPLFHPSRLRLNNVVCVCFLPVFVIFWHQLAEHARKKMSFRAPRTASTKANYKSAKLHTNRRNGLFNVFMFSRQVQSKQN